MLKIKDDVDLKELEKFGFKVHKTNSKEYYMKKLIIRGNQAYITIQPISREIKIDCDTTYILNLDIIYELIQADLVEQVVE